MSNLIEIQSQIEKLQKQANDIKAKEFARTVQEIVAQMRAFGITSKDLQSGSARKEKAKVKVSTKAATGKARKAGTTTVPAKYHGPNGETWSGRGLTPRWLAALVTQGKKKEDFAINN